MYILLSISSSTVFSATSLSAISWISSFMQSNYSGRNKRFFCLRILSLNIRSGLALILYSCFAVFELLLRSISNFSFSWFDSICNPMIYLKMAFSLLSRIGPVCSWLWTYKSIYFSISWRNPVGSALSIYAKLLPS